MASHSNNQDGGLEEGSILTPNSGVNVYLPKNAIPQGMVSQADNVVIDFGVFQQRWAKVGLIQQGSILTGDRVPQLIDFYDSSNVLWLVFVQDGKLWKLDETVGIPVQIPLTAADGTTPVTLDTPNAAIIRCNDRIIVVDGTIDFTVADLTSGTAAVGLNAPTIAPSAALTFSTLMETYNAAWWSQIGAQAQIGNTLPSLNDPNGQFNGSAYPAHDSSPLPDTWQRFGHDPDMNGFWFNADNYDEGAFVLANSTGGGYGNAGPPLAVPGWIENNRFSANPANPAYVLRPSRFFAQIQCSRNVTSSMTGRMFFIAYSDDAGTIPIANLEFDFTANADGSLTNASHIFDLSALPATIQVGSYAFWVQAGAASNRKDSNHDGFLINNASLTPMSTQIQFISGLPGAGVYLNPGVPIGTGSSSSSGSSSSVSSSLSSSSSATTPGQAGQLQPYDIDGVLDLAYTSVVYQVEGVSPTATTATHAITAGANTLSVTSSTGYAAGQTIFVTDGTHQAHFLVTGTGGGTITGTYTPLAGDSGVGVTLGNPSAVSVTFDFSKIETIYFGLTGVASWTNLGFNLYLHHAGDDALTWNLATNGTLITTDGKALVCDITTIDENTLSSVDEIRLQFNQNPTWVAPFSFLQIGPLNEAGNLSVDVLDNTQFPPYFWAFTEADIVGSLIIESNGSPPSNQLIATVTMAEADITLDSSEPTNPATNYYGFYRRDADGVLRLLAYVPTGSDIAYGEDSGDPSGIDNPYFSWNHTTKVFHDNTPDDFLFQAQTIPTTHGVAPKNLAGLALWQGRLFAWEHQNLWYTQLLVAGVGPVFYWNSVNFPDSPTITTEGGMEPIGDPNQSDPILTARAIGTPVGAENAFGGALGIWCARLYYVMSGTNASNFSVTAQNYALGVGVIGRNAVARYNAWAIAFLGNDRGHLYPPTYRRKLIDVEALWQPIEPYLYPSGRNGFFPIAANVQALSWMVFHDNNLVIAYADSTQADQTDNTVLFWLNTRYNCWTRWTDMPFASLCPVGPNTVSGQDYSLYAGGTDGQIYRLDPAVSSDTAYPGATPTAIPVSVTSRGIGSEGPEFRDIKAKVAKLDADSSETITMRIESSTGFYYDFPIPWPSTRYRIRKDLGVGVVGNYCTIGARVNSLMPVSFYAMELTVAHAYQAR